jgi:hypothetical protein
MQCSGSATSVSVANGASFRPVASTRDVMDGIIIPASQAVFDGVVYANGALVQAPRTDDDWFRIRMQALAVAEAGNLLLIPPRARDATWSGFAQAMTARAAAAAMAAQAKNVDQLLAAGSDLYQTCTACHAAFLMEQP